jgi:hypothetical protein
MTTDDLATLRQYPSRKILRTYKNLTSFTQKRLQETK